MNSTKKMTALLLSLIMLCSLLVGCGGGNGKETEKTTTATTPSSEINSTSTTASSSTENKGSSTTASSSSATETAPVQTGVTVRLGGLKGPTSIGMAKLIEDAKNEAIENILEASAYKSEGNCKALIVTGCLAELYRDDVTEEIPEVDVCVGIGANSRR